MLVTEDMPLGLKIKNTCKRRFITQLFLVNEFFKAGYPITPDQLSRKITGKSDFTEFELSVINTALGTDFKLS